MLETELLLASVYDDLNAKIETLRAAGVKGDKGDKGDRGLDGKDGKNGVNGKDGADGKDGTNGSVLANATIATDNPFQTRIDFSLVRGDYIIITGTGTIADCDVVVEFGEAV